MCGWLLEAGGNGRRPPALVLLRRTAPEFQLHQAHRVAAVGKKLVGARTAFPALVHHIMALHCFSLLFDVFDGFGGSERDWHM